MTCLLLFILDLVLKQAKVISIFSSPMQSRKLCNREFRTSQKSGYIRNYKSVSCQRKVHLSVITAKAAGPYDDCNVKYALLYGHPVNTASSLLLPLYSGRNKSLVSHVVRIQVLEEQVQWHPPLEISSET